MAHLRVGWIGMGAMGAPMATGLLEEGFSVLCYDADPSAIRRVTSDGSLAADSARASAADADVVALMVANAEQVEDVLFGDDGAASAMKQNAVVMLMATVGDRPIARWASLLAERGVALVDAPVSGGVERARQGTLLMMISGSPEAVEVVRPLVNAMASHAPLVGNTAGDGQRMKIVNQLLCGVHIAAAAEALALAERLGLDPLACWETLRHGAANSFMFEDRGQRMVSNDPERRSAVDIFIKDMHLVREAVEAAGGSSPLVEAAESLFLKAGASGLGRMDDSSVVRVALGQSLGALTNPSSNPLGKDSDAH